MAIDVLLGLQWGDEGKGKIVDFLADQYDMVCRFQGGPNAGHTIIIGDKKRVLHTIPSGIFRENMINLIGNGVVIDPITLEIEIKGLEADNISVDNLYIAKKAHLILPTHRYLDALSEAQKGKDKIGTTLRGISPTYMDRTGRNGLRVGDVVSTNFIEKYEKLRDKHMGMIAHFGDLGVQFDLEVEESKWMESLTTLRQLHLVNGEYFINKAIKKGKRILAEGAQGSMLDVDFGTYPYVTSSNTITAGVCYGLGVAPQHIKDVIGIAKAYCTRVGAGPFPTELFNANGERLRKLGFEFGATTGRPRRCGWIDIPQLNYAIMINGVTKLVITKLDVLNSFSEFQVGTSYHYDNKDTTELPFDINAQTIEINYETIEGWDSDLANIHNYNDLPNNAKSYIEYLEKELEVPIKIISTGPERNELIEK